MKNNNYNTKNLSISELKTINGGDGITEGFFYALGWINSVGKRLFQDRPLTRLGASRPFE
jgi:bacteriocin-like protein